MKAIGRYLVVTPEKQGQQKTKGGLMLAENARDDLRYNKATVKSIGSEVLGIKEGSEIYYDKHAGHNIEIDKTIYKVIQLQDVVIVL